MGQLRNVIFIFILTVLAGILTLVLANLFDIFLKPYLLPLALIDFIKSITLYLHYFQLGNMLYG